jgi:hypothetical protein
MPFAWPTTLAADPAPLCCRVQPLPPCTFARAMYLGAPCTSLYLYLCCHRPAGRVINILRTASYPSGPVLEPPASLTHGAERRGKVHLHPSKGAPVLLAALCNSEAVNPHREATIGTLIPPLLGRICVEGWQASCLTACSYSRPLSRLMRHLCSVCRWPPDWLPRISVQSPTSVNLHPTW